jgi:hypothetical protein
MDVLTTIISQPVNGRTTEAINQINELKEIAEGAGALRATASRVISGPNIGNLQLRVFSNDIVHAGEISGAMWSSDVAARSQNDTNPSGQLVGLIRSSVVHRAAPFLDKSIEPAIATVLAVKPHPGRIAELESVLSQWADQWVAGGALQSFVTSAITGTPGPALFVTAAYPSWESWSDALGSARESELWQNLREDSDPAGVVMGNTQLSAV